MIEIDDTPTPIERAYVKRGYRLPRGWTWSLVHRFRRLAWRNEADLPIAVRPDAVSWARPQRVPPPPPLSWWRALAVAVPIAALFYVLLVGILAVGP
jgi:hypothetical protein